MKKVVIVKEVMATDREEDEEEVQVIANNISIEMKKDLKTNLR